MASRKRQPEGIALLSMYDDEEDDDDMDEAEEHGKQEQEEEDEEDRRGEREERDQHGDASMPDAVDSNNATSGVDDESSGQFRRSASQQQLSQRPGSPEQAAAVERSRRRGTLVDYGHDEAAMSPEPEEGEIDRSGGVLPTNGDSQGKTPQLSDQATPRVSEPSHSDAMNENIIESEGRNAEETVGEDQKGVDPLDKFLPPPSKIKCSEDLQRKIQRFLELKRAGKSFNEEVRKKKDYRNPDFLLHAVRFQDIDQIGSCFSKDVFDPHGFDKSDYYDEIEADSRRELERINQEKKNRQNVDFASGGRLTPIVGVAPTPNAPLPGITVPATGLSSLPRAADIIPRDGRQNKKSKWDKIDGTQATLLSSANAGGYTLGQQKRREVEEKRSGEKKLDRRS
ncbi:uncharacterized protein LOC126788728 [Argentina anserina]|uniref:uncharacterized protein LOC126788728 n=1 Tax=Argentina anserina TaxID=57926 RepID=UPI00217638AF|nr:uncharacterized protein LOC126788728 [Potentilla anserina]